MTASLPTPGGDNGVWGTKLNTFLQVAHNPDGTSRQNPRNPHDLISEVISDPIVTGRYDGLGTTLFGSDGRILIAYRSAPGNILPGEQGYIVTRYSLDQGHTFSSPTTIADRTAQSKDIRDVGGGTTRSGRMVLFMNDNDLTKLTDNGGIGYALTTFYYYSDDNGATWVGPNLYYTGTNTDWSFAVASSRVVEIGAGLHMMTMWRWVTNNGALSGCTAYVKAFFSSDNGTTWGNEVTVGSSNISIGLTECCAAYLGGGYIVVVARADYGTKFYQFTSADNGATWTANGQWTGDTWPNIPSPPHLAVYEDPTVGGRRVALYYANRDALKLRVATASASGLISSNVAAWTAPADIVSTGSFDAAYPSVIHPFGDPRGFGWFYNNDGIHDVAAPTFFSYTAPVAGVPTTGIGALIEHVPRTTDLTVTGSSGSQQTWISGAAHTYDGATKIEVRVQTAIGQVTNGGLIIELWKDGSSVGRVAELSTGSTNEGLPLAGSYFDTPASGSHTYIAKAWTDGSSATLYGASGTFTPAFLRITTAA